MPSYENGSPDTKGLTDRSLPNSQILRGGILPAVSKLSQWHAVWISSTTIFRDHFLWRAERSLDAFRQALVLTAQVVTCVGRLNQLARECGITLRMRAVAEMEGAPDGHPR